jgi:hypothetical protein
MINPKKTIPKLVGAIIALTGAQACGDDAATATREQVDSAIDAFCMKVESCNIGLTMQQCTVSYQMEVNNSYGTPQCFGAIVSYANCQTGLSCDELVADSNRCDDLYDPVYDAC